MRIPTLVMVVAFIACSSHAAPLPPPAAGDPPPPGCDPNASGWTVWVPNQGIGVDSVFVFKPHDSPGGDGARVDADLLATIPVGRAPHNVGFSPDGRFAYVANLGGGGGLGSTGKQGSVSIIDTASYAVVATVPTGQLTHATASTPDGRYVWVANIRSNDVAVIDTATWKLDGPPIGVTGGPAEIAFTSDGATAFVSAGVSGSVAVIDVAARKVTAAIPTGMGSMGIVVTRDQKLVMETEPGDDRVSIIDESSRAVVKALGMHEAHGIDLAGHEAVVTNSDPESVAILDTRSLEKIAGIQVSGTPQHVAVSPDCRRAYAALLDTPGVAVIDVESRKLLGVIDVGKGALHGVGVLPAGQGGAR